MNDVLSILTGASLAAIFIVLSPRASESRRHAIYGIGVVTNYRLVPGLFAFLVDVERLNGSEAPPPLAPRVLPAPL